MRRSSGELQERYDMREIWVISDADGPGYLYAYVKGDFWKVGMSHDFAQHQEEWDKECPCPWRAWFLPIRVANRRRAESLAHLLLEMECLDRPQIYCQNCQQVHIKKFVFYGPLHVLWTTIVYPILLRAAVLYVPAEQVLDGRTIRYTEILKQKVLKHSKILETLQAPRY
ncbi:hypothetical protein GG344DRAFT_63701 [Lentinula edodes]|nr:hypothetical protein GG344DRAFT_63701 [Lentinula edodes]